MVFHAYSWTTPLPDGVNPETAGPLFCGGITVLNSIVQCNIKPTDKVGVIGIGGLGHMAIQFLKAWGCEVTAFSSNASKEHEVKQLGAHHFVNSRDPNALKSVENSLDFILSTVNVDTVAKMLDFIARHHIEPVAEIFPLEKVNEAMAHLEAGKARYRIILKV